MFNLDDFDDFFLKDELWVINEIYDEIIKIDFYDNRQVLKDEFLATFPL